MTAPKRGIRLLRLEDVDARTVAGRHVRETRMAIAADLGGEAELSTIERAAVDHLAIIDGMLKDAAARWLRGEEVEVSTVASLASTFNRTAGIVGWRRRAREKLPTLQAYVSSMKSRPSSDEEGGEGA